MRHVYHGDRRQRRSELENLRVVPAVRVTEVVKEAGEVKEAEGETVERHSDFGESAAGISCLHCSTCACCLARCASNVLNAWA